MTFSPVKRRIDPETRALDHQLASEALLQSAGEVSTAVRWVHLDRFDYPGLDAVL